MKRDEALVNKHLCDLNPLILGEEKCEPSHSYGPIARKYTLIHFVVRGSGTFCRGGKNYTVNAGQAFIILPDEITTYCASESDPWYYRWVGFNGSLSARFSELEPVVYYKTDWAKEMLSIECDKSVYEYEIASKLFMMYSEFFADKHQRNDYTETVKDYINALYMQQIRVEDIAERMNLDRRYLSRIFKQKTGKSIQEYIITVRMDEAKKLLEKGCSVLEASQLCGYEDVCNFSKMFKSRTGVSPGKWKKHSTV